MKRTTEIIEVAEAYRIKYETPKGRAECIKGILEGRAVFCETYGKERHSFHPVKGRKGRRLVE